MDPYLKEYSSDQSIKKYVKEDAGHGISYILDNIYGPLYLDVIKDVMKTVDIKNGLRVLEFGCGAGMNLMYLVKLLSEHGIKLDAAYGTDFSERMIDSAKIEAKKYLDEEHQNKVNFFVASNENLYDELSEADGMMGLNISNSFHLVFGINTFRYCHRLNKSRESAKHIYNLSVKGGHCIMIDMNNKYPFFLSKFRDRLTKPKEEYYLPTLEEYVEAFRESDFEVLTNKQFCWIPHSAKGIRFAVCKALTPILDKLVPNYAMRSLVISKKPF